MKVKGKDGVYWELVAFLEQVCNTEGRQGSVCAFPFTFKEKYVYFLNLAWEIIVSSVKTTWGYIFLIEKPNIIATMNMFVFFLQ